jgi:hypothetical protein
MSEREEGDEGEGGERASLKSIIHDLDMISSLHHPSTPAFLAL